VSNTMASRTDLRETIVDLDISFVPVQLGSQPPLLSLLYPFLYRSHSSLILSIPDSIPLGTITTSSSSSEFHVSLRDLKLSSPLKLLTTEIRTLPLSNFVLAAIISSWWRSHTPTLSVNECNTATVEYCRLPEQDNKQTVLDRLLYLLPSLRRNPLSSPSRSDTSVETSFPPPSITLLPSFRFPPPLSLSFSLSCTLVVPLPGLPLVLKRLSRRQSSTSWQSSGARARADASVMLETLIDSAASEGGGANDYREGGRIYVQECYVTQLGVGGGVFNIFEVRFWNRLWSRFSLI
jgi:hypothetical protein